MAWAGVARLDPAEPLLDSLYPKACFNVTGALGSENG